MRRAAFIAIVSFLLSACPTADQGGRSVSEYEARTAAESAFKNATDNKVLTYEIKSWQPTTTEWVFVVEGTGEYQRPGFHWMISVNKETGDARVEPGA